MNKHRKTCLCCQCTQHRRCIQVNNPQWICLLPDKINEIKVGPLDPLQADGILALAEMRANSFLILNKYVYPDYLTGMIKLCVITSTPYIVEPGQPLASLCHVTTKDVFNEINGKNFIFIIRFFYISTN
jgi:hypothetical protein